jgi:two-component system LytT family response regulator
VIRTLIVDDEPLARDALRILLGREHDIEIVGEAGSGDDAVAAILHHQPDLVLLDVQMPGCDGFQVLERVAEQYLPEVIFVTAFERHAVRAFDVHALDYLLKPVEEARLAQALRRARAALEQGMERDSPERLTALLDVRSGAFDHGERRFVARERGHFVLVRTGEVQWIRSARNYVELHTARGMFLVRGTLGALERELNPFRFARIHRTVIVDLDRIRAITPNAYGDFEVLLDGGVKLPMSRTYRERVLGTEGLRGVKRPVIEP